MPIPNIKESMKFIYEYLIVFLIKYRFFCKGGEENGNAFKHCKRDP